MTRCVISGGGPAGLMAGFLLARAGVEVVVLEKHRDFLRDFRGDTIHPSTLRIMEALGLLDELLALPHYPFRHMEFSFGDRPVPVVDFTPLGERTGFVAMMPQWDFLDFVAQQAAACPGFTLRMETESETLIEEGGRVTGLRAGGPSGPVEIRADLVLVADGRHSGLRDAAGLDLRDLGAPIDVLWFRVSRKGGENPESLGRLKDGSIIIQLNRGDYWQMAFVVPKDGAEAVRANGLAAFRRRVGAATGIEAARLEEIDDWTKVKLLSVQVNRLALVARGALVHRRRGACDVAGGGRGHQPGRAGCGGGGEYPGRAAAQRDAERGRFAAGAAPPRMADAGDAARSGPAAGPRDPPGAGRARRPAAAALAASGARALSAALPGSVHRAGPASGTAPRGRGQPGCGAGPDRPMNGR